MGEAKPHNPETHEIPSADGACGGSRLCGNSSRNHNGKPKRAAAPQAHKFGEAPQRRPGKRCANCFGRTFQPNSEPPKQPQPRRNGFFIRAIRRQKPCPALTAFRLCKEFGWTPSQLARQPAKTIQQFIVILNELDRQAEMEKAKMERQTRWRLK